MTPADEIASSRVRLRIADLLSVRPRTLGELAEETGISIQGVLKHLKRIEDAGRLEETELRGNKFLGIRKVYSLKGKIGSYSRDGLMVTHYSAQGRPAEVGPKADVAELEAIAENIILQRRRIGSLAKRMERLIVELESSEERLEEAIHTRGLSSELELVLMALFTEVSVQDAERVLSKNYACPDPGAAIAAALGGLRSA